MSPRTLIPFFTSDQCRNTAPACCMCMGNGISATAWHPGPTPASTRAFPTRVALCPSSQDARTGVTWWRSTTKSCLETLNVLPRSLAMLPTSARYTSFVERENLAFRQHNRRLTRRTNGLSKELPWLEKQLWLSLAYTHLVLPHDSLSQNCRGRANRGTGSPRRWQPRTPAMAAGLTDHVWTPRVAVVSRPAHLFDQLGQLEHRFLA